MRLLYSFAAAVTLFAATPAAADRRRDAMVYEHIDPSIDTSAVNSNIIFLNQCKNGCPVLCNGNTSSLSDSSSVCPGGQRVLSKFKAGDGVWSEVVQCVKEVFSPFGVQITDVDPGQAPHFEIMIAGSDSDLGLSGLGGVSPFNCSAQYIPNSLVFDFADTYGADVDEICAVAAQEIAHSFRLDHVTEASDPLTYFTFIGRRFFKDAAVKCGSDCVGGQGPFGQTCNGAMGQEHSCSCTGQATQNSVQTITALFGAAALSPPMVTISRPKNGDHVEPGFPINSAVVDDIAVKMVELRIDGVLVTTLDAAPYVWNAPATIGDGTHRVEVTGYDLQGTSAKAIATVYIGAPCTKPADCANETDTCIGGRCVPGAGVQGGLGTTCANNEACASGLCVNGTDGMLCSDTCDLAMPNQCPSGFLCLEGGSIGVCYPGEEDTGCSTSGNPIGAIGLGLGFALLVVRRRRR